MRSYENKDMVPLPVVGGPDAVVLVRQISTSYSTQTEALKAEDKSLPSNVVKAMTKLTTAAATLSQALQPLGADTKAAISADSVLDDAWGAFRDWLTGFWRLPASRFPAADQVAALYRLMFSDGLAFLKLAYRNEWQESEARLEKLAQSHYPALIASLGGALFLEHLTESHAQYGATLGITAPPAEVAQEVRDKLTATLDALRDYVLKTRASIDSDDPATEVVADALLEPLIEWQSRQSGSSSSSTVTSTPAAG